MTDAPAPQPFYCLVSATGVVAGVSIDGPEHLQPVPDGMTLVGSSTQPWPGQSYDATTETFANPAPPAPTQADLVAYANRKQDETLAQIWSFNVGTAEAPAVLTTRLDASGQASMLQLLMWAKVLAADGDTQPYNMADGSAGPNITPAQAISLATQAGATKSATFATLNEIAIGISASPPTIKTPADIDAAAWPTAAA